MKKLVVAVVIALVAAFSFADISDARSRNGGFQWHSGHGGGNWRGHGGRHYGGRHYGYRHHGYRHGYRHRGYRHYGYRHGGRYNGGPYYGWGPGWGYWGGYGGYWGGVGIVVGPGYYDDYCYIRKVRRYDQWGNMYIRRVRVCR